MLARDFYLLCFYIVFVLGVIVRRGRPTHRRGVAGAGTMTVIDAPTLPANGFFQPGRRFRAVVRHGNVSNDDDAGLDIRGAAIKLVDLANPDAPGLDLVMNTGEVSFSTARDFLRYAFASAPRPWSGEPVDIPGLKRFLVHSPRIHFQFVSGLRRAPGSFACLRYHSQIVHRLNAVDALERFMRFRLIPAEAGPEDGLLSESDRTAPWNPERLAGEARDYDYLRAEFRDRLNSTAGVSYALEAQVLESDRDGRRPLFDPLLDPGAAWPENAHPWLPIGTLRLTAPLSAAEAEQLSFNIANLPSALDFPDCRSIDDFFSVAYCRSHVYRATKAARGALNAVGGWLARRRAEEARQSRQGPPGATLAERRTGSLWTLVFGHLVWSLGFIGASRRMRFRLRRPWLSEKTQPRSAAPQDFPPYHGSSFDQMLEVLRDSPYTKNGRLEPGSLPDYALIDINYVLSRIPNCLLSHFRKTRSELESHSRRVLHDRRDFFADKPPKPVHTNGIAFTGEWIIDHDTGLTGYFAGGSRGLFMGRLSIMNGILRRGPGTKRSIGFAGKVYPTLNSAAVVRPANFVLMETFFGNDAYFLEIPLTNNPTLTLQGPLDFCVEGLWKGKIFGLAEANAVFKSLDPGQRLRPMDEISRLGLLDGAPSRTPVWMRLEYAGGRDSIVRRDDFREELWETWRARGELVYSITVSIQLIEDAPDRVAYLSKADLAETRESGVKFDWIKIGRIVLKEGFLSEGADHRTRFHHPVVVPI